MYPRISDFFNDVFGWNLNLPIQSFGFFMAMAFVVAYYIVTREYRRQTRLGIFPTHNVKVWKGGPIKISEILVNVLLYGLLGYKVLPMFLGQEGFVENPQEALLSLKGSIWGGLLLAGLAGGFKFFQYLKRKDTQPEEVVEERGLADEMGIVFVIAFVAGVLGAKIFHNLENLDDFFADPVGQLLSFSGLTFYGGLICAGAAIGWYINRKGYKLLPFIDTASLVLILGYGIGRIGCQVSGDGDWGITNTAPKPDWLSWAPDWLWAYDYPNNVLGRVLEDPVFPTPIYETTMAFMIFGFLWYLRKRLPYWGQLFGIYLMLNGLERFWIEKIRVNNTVATLGGIEITQAEIISSLMFLAGCVFLYLTTFVWKRGQEPGGRSQGSGSDGPAGRQGEQSDKERGV